MNRNVSELPVGGQPDWVKRCCRGISRLIYGDIDIKGLENMPPYGPFIVAATHRSYLDPVLVGSFLPRNLYFMGKRELFSIPLLGTLIRALGTFPIDREAARASTFRLALNVLKHGGAVVIFPEGGIVESFNENAFKAGVGSLASLSGAPILPVVIAGSRLRIKWRQASADYDRLSIRIGPVISSSAKRGREGRQAAALLTFAVIQEMIQELETSRHICPGRREA